MRRFLNITAIKQIISNLARQGLTNREISLGIAVGIFAGISPFIGIQTLMCIALAYVLRLNQVVVFLGAQVTNPITYPFITFLNVQVGSLILKGQFLEMKTHDIDVLQDYVVPILVGGMSLAFSVSFISYFVVQYLLKRFRP